MASVAELDHPMLVEVVADSALATKKVASDRARGALDGVVAEQRDVDEDDEVMEETRAQTRLGAVSRAPASVQDAMASQEISIDGHREEEDLLWDVAPSLEKTAPAYRSGR